MFFFHQSCQIAADSQLILRVSQVRPGGKQVEGGRADLQDLQALRQAAQKDRRQDHQAGLRPLGGRHQPQVHREERGQGLH